MKIHTLVFVTGLLMLKTPVGLAYGENGYYDTARVLRADPIYREIEISEPERHCYRQPRVYRDKSYSGLIAGSIIGGVIGNQFGHNSGRDALTVAGSLLGASIANDLGRDHYQRYEERYCEVTYRSSREEALIGYDVAYRYHGKTFHRRMRSHPGRYVRVFVRIEPASED